MVADPRRPEMGWRIYGASTGSNENDAYTVHRIATGMPAGGEDFEYGDAFPHDCLMDQFGGVDFKKGCYVGQEVVSRMQHRGTARKRIVKVAGTAPLPKSGAIVSVADKPAGSLGTVRGSKGLAMVRLDRIARARADGAPILAEGTEIELTLPDWAGFSWPEAGVR